MSFYSKNLSLIQKKNHEIKLTEPDNSLELLKTKSGDITALKNGILIHSKFNPVKEASDIITRECKEIPGVCIFYGFGLGYHIEIFLKHFPDTVTIVLIPDLSFFLKALESRDMTGFLSNPNLNIFIDKNPDNFLKYLSGFSQSREIEDIKTFKLRPLYILNEDYYKRIDGIIQSHNSRKEINYNTLERFGKLWVKNLLKNMTTLSRSPGISLLESVFSSIPALIIASGPSLDNIIPFIPELYKKMLIITVDTSLRAVLDTGIEPDFIIIADPQYWNTRHIDGLKVNNSILISESSTHPRIFRQLDVMTFFGSSLFPLGQYFESFLGTKGRLGAGGSVSTSAWDFTRIIGSKNIFMAGLDLGYPFNNTHYKGAFFEKRFHSFTDRINPVSALSYSYFLEADPFLINSNSGNLVFTDKRMMVYKWWFESQMNLFPGINTFNLSEHGVKIKGMPYKPLKYLYELPDVRGNILSKAEDIRREYGSYCKEENLKKLSSALDKLRSELGRIKDLSMKAVNELKHIEKLINDSSDISAKLESLNKIDMEILQTGTRQIAGFLIQPFIQKLSKNPDNKKTKEEIIGSSIEFYNKLKISSEYHYDLITKSFESISG